MITGTHLLLFSTDPEADRAFFRDVLRFPAVDAGEGWLIFALPPAELGVHPAEGDRHQAHAGHQLLGAVLYLMCDDIEATVKELKAKGVEFLQPIKTEVFGLLTSMRIPGAGELHIYEPRHPSPLKK